MSLPQAAGEGNHRQQEADSLDGDDLWGRHRGGVGLVAAAS
jgi:hypothetical protein